MRVRLIILALAALAIAGCGKGAGQIDLKRLMAADQHPGEWLTAGRDSGKTYYSPLTDINTTTAGRLGFAWDYDVGTHRGLESTPIVVDGVMYTSGVAGRVYALDAKTGALIWKFEPPVDMQVTRSVCCDNVNRGVAVWRGKVYVGALDGVLYALDAKSGAVDWKVDTITDRSRGYSSTGAPQVAGDVVVIGNAGSDMDARGYITAYDLDTGKQVWRFYTVPGDPSKPRENPELAMAAKTWDPNSEWQFGGGGAVWGGLAYDPALDLVYAGVGNANTYPRARRSPAGGDNLFAASVLAINAKTGRLAWYYQETPGDQWDYDSTAPMILTDLTINGQVRQVLMHAPKNGFFYVLDRKTGELLSAGKVTRANWATGIDLKTGRPIEDKAAADYTTGPKMVFPGVPGGHNWNPMAYDPQTGLVYVPTIEAGNIIYADPNPAPRRQGQGNMGVTQIFTGQLADKSSLPPNIQALLTPEGLLKGSPDLRMRAFLRAYDPINNKVVWQAAGVGWWDYAGVLATGGGIVVQGSADGHLRVRDARSGQLLKDIDTGSSIIAAPMTYQIDGVQYVAVMAGWGGGGWFMPHPENAAYRYSPEGRILVFKLDGGATPKPALAPPPAPFTAPPAQTADAATIARGAALFQINCTVCHVNLPGAAAPDLRRLDAATHAAFKDIVLGGAFVSDGMPRWNDKLTPADADAIHAYLIDQQAKAYADQEAKSAGGSTTPSPSHGF